MKSKCNGGVTIAVWKQSNKMLITLDWILQINMRNSYFDRVHICVYFVLTLLCLIFTYMQLSTLFKIYWDESLEHLV